MIEGEQVHELRVPAARGMPAYVELSVAAEGIFTNHNQATPLPEDGGDLERFLATYGASLLCYGYPYLQYADGSIRPLFLMRAKIDDGVLYPDPDGHVKMNCSLLRDQGMDSSLMQVLAHKMADPAVPSTEKLSAIANHPDLDEGRFIPPKLGKGTSSGPVYWSTIAVPSTAVLVICTISMTNASRSNWESAGPRSEWRLRHHLEKVKQHPNQFRLWSYAATTLTYGFG